MTRCPRCDLNLATEMPKVGEVWLRMDTGRLYVVIDASGYGALGVTERLHPRGQQGADPEWRCAIWKDAVLRGEWVKVEGMTIDDVREGT